jgi:hypothetical protein
MEPFRPWVDSIAYQLYQKNANISITKEVKMPFLDLIHTVKMHLCIFFTAGMTHVY